MSVWERQLGRTGSPPGWCATSSMARSPRRRGRRSRLREASDSAPRARRGYRIEQHRVRPSRHEYVAEAGPAAVRPGRRSPPLCTSEAPAVGMPRLWDVRDPGRASRTRRRGRHAIGVAPNGWGLRDSRDTRVGCSTLAARNRARRVFASIHSGTPPRSAKEALWPPLHLPARRSLCRCPGTNSQPAGSVTAGYR